MRDLSYFVNRFSKSRVIIFCQYVFKVEIYHIFLICFQSRDLSCFANMFSKSFATELVYVKRKGWIHGIKGSAVIQNQYIVSVGDRQSSTSVWYLVTGSLNPESYMPVFEQSLRKIQTKVSLRILAVQSRSTMLGIHVSFWHRI